MEEVLIEYINEVAEGKNVKIERNTDLFEAGVLDSLEIIKLLSFLQDHSGFTFNPEDLQFENFQTVDSIITWLTAKKG